MSTRDFLLPDLGEGLAEAEVVRWLVDVGDDIDVYEPLVEVMTAKATIELPSPFEGRVMAIHFAPGERVKVGQPLVSFALQVDLAALAPPAAGVVVLQDGVMVVTGDDVRTTTEVRGEQMVPIIGAHRKMAEVASRSRHEIPEATLWVATDASGLLRARQAWRAKTPQSPPVALVTLVMRFCALGLRRWPALNGRVGPEAVVLNPSVNIGFAAQTRRGPMVPVVARADELSLPELDAEVRRLTSQAREGSLSERDQASGTFTVNNYGVFGIDGATAIINYPEVAVLGIGRVTNRPWVVEGELAVRPVTELTLAFDHRVCDGGTAAAFLRFVADCIEEPQRAL